MVLLTTDKTTDEWQGSASLRALFHSTSDRPWPTRSFHCRYHQPMFGFVFPDVDVAEACVGEMCPNLFGRIGMHPLDEASAFLDSFGINL